MNGKFYVVTEEEIAQAEEALKIDFPSELKAFYHSFGYGFLASAHDNVNRVMDPLSIVSYTNKEDEYEDYPGIDEVDFDGSKLPFFEVSLGVVFSIEITSRNTQRIYYDEILIAESLAEFLSLYEQDELFYIAILKALYNKSKE